MEVDVLIHWLWNTDCNFKCAYCSVSNKIKRFASYPALSRFFPYKHYGSGNRLYYEYDKMVDWFNTMGKTFCLHFAGGEVFLGDDFMRLCTVIAKDHYIGLSTNLVLPQARKFADTYDPRRVRCVIASLHLEELATTGSMKDYIENYLLFKKNGFPLQATVVAYPPLREKISFYRKYLGDSGVDFFYRPFVGFYQGKYYPDAYTDEEIAAFGLDLRVFMNRPRLCNAGNNVCFAHPHRGQVYFSPCPWTSKHIGKLYSHIDFSDKIIKCSKKECSCPLQSFEPELFNSALKKSKVAK